MEANCKNCRFFVKIGDETDDEFPCGECHRFPPVPDDDRKGSEWPLIIFSSDQLPWCGEHQMIEIKSQTDDDISSLDLSSRAQNAIGRLKVKSISELAEIPRIDLMRLSGVGTATAREIEVALYHRGRKPCDGNSRMVKTWITNGSIDSR